MCSRPEKGVCISRISITLAETDRAESSSTAITVELRGANRPKLQKSVVSQKMITTRKGVETLLLSPMIESQRVLITSLPIESACDCCQRWASSFGVSARMPWRSSSPEVGALGIVSALAGGGPSSIAATRVRNSSRSPSRSGRVSGP